MQHARARDPHVLTILAHPPTPAQAVAHKRKHRLPHAPGITAKAAALGSKYGVGVGLYFETLHYLRLLLCWLALLAVSVQSV
jgi:hypothetical protein